MIQNIFALFGEHIQARQQSAEVTLVDNNFDALIIHSGVPRTYFADDQEIIFHTNPHFASWVPLLGPHHLLLIRHGFKPLVFIVTPLDYWYEHRVESDPFWREHFECREVHSESEAWVEIQQMLVKQRVAYVGSNESFQSWNVALEQINPETVITALERARSFKTAYEIACIEEANKVASKGHRAARDVFLSGGSELDIHFAYMKTLQYTEKELPYETIVALNEKGSILHYQGKRKDISGTVLLLDAGAQHNGYCSDITRTFVHESCNPLFAHLVARVDALQRELVQTLTPGTSFKDFHRMAELKIADALYGAGIITCAGNDAVERGLIKPFFPHGIGHYLGIQVHDVDGSRSKKEGDTALRTERVIEVGQVFTIEPGIYFIPLLLSKFRTGEHSSSFHWALIDQLTPCGGVRIEDDVLMKSDGVYNITRSVLTFDS